MKFDELDDFARKRAIENQIKFEGSVDSWYIYELEEFAERMQSNGVDVDARKITFDVDYSQSAFIRVKFRNQVSDALFKYAGVDLPAELRQAIKDADVDESVLDEFDLMLDTGATYVEGVAERRSADVEIRGDLCDFVFDDNLFSEDETQQLDQAFTNVLDKFIHALEGRLVEDASALFDEIRDQCDFWFSEENIVDIIRANDYDFDVHGNLI